MGSVRACGPFERILWRSFERNVWVSYKKVLDIDHCGNVDEAQNSSVMVLLMLKMTHRVAHWSCRVRKPYQQGEYAT